MWVSPGVRVSSEIQLGKDILPAPFSCPYCQDSFRCGYRIKDHGSLFVVVLSSLFKIGFIG